MNVNYLIDQWSFSSMRDYLNNRYKFLMTWVLKTWKFKMGPSGHVGKAGHKALEHLLKGASVDQAIGMGLSYINNLKDEDVKWGKTGSREKMIEQYTFAINAFISEMPKLDTVAVEESLTEFIKPIPGIMGSDEFDFPIPAKCVIDHIERLPNGKIKLNDWKFVSKFTEPEEEKPLFIFQAMFGFHTARAKYGVDPVSFTFHECKVTQNKDGSPQMQQWSIDFTDPQYAPWFAVFYRVYDACSREISREDAIFLPNIADMMDGEETLKLFAGETVGMDRPTIIKHKTEHVEPKEFNYVPSVADKTENKTISEEEKIRLKLQEFGIAVEMRETFIGHSVIKYTMKPSRAKRMSDFAKMDKDIAIALKAKSVRIEAPIMGTDLVGIEVPNPLRTFIQMPAVEATGKLIIPVGVDVYGKTIEKDLADAPHLLVAGATGAGKSVFLNVLIESLLAQNTPEQMKLVLIDPKRVELSAFKSKPHLLAPPIYEVEDAIKTLLWLTDEMEERYRTLEAVGCRNIDEYNSKTAGMAKIVVVIDEFADLMLQTKQNKVKGVPNMAEVAIVRLAQKARAVGIHVVLGTQRPSVDVVTGLIKANFPTRIAFATAQEIDSRIILDQSGAETLLGKGDMLFLDPAQRDLVRLQSFYV